MALYAFDGTGNVDEEESARDSNVVDFFSAYIDPKKNVDPKEDVGSLYLKGIGRRAKTLVGKGVAEAFGIGGHERVRQALGRLQNNLDAGDNIVDIAGFSRGAALAMSFANEIDKQQPDVTIRFIGVFDVVGQFGLPGRYINAGHVLTLPKNVKTCRHAMALDETRELFPLTRLCDHHGKPADSLVEVWFRGVHSDVGGGNGNRGMNWIALNWLFRNALKAGLPIDEREVERNLQDRGLPQKITRHDVDLHHKRTFFQTDCMHESVLLDAPPDRLYNNPPFTLRRINDEGVFAQQANV
jgi:uncharacterized protein (DUF2235 family)